jgi:cytochrome c biogenesis protein CcmG/thiol:disulfide interchange protein DsbE
MKYIWYVLILCLGYGLWENYTTVVPQEIRDKLPFRATGISNDSPSLLSSIPSSRGGAELETFRKPLPSFALTQVGSGKRWTQADFRGTPTVLVFFAGWCGPCQQNMPTIHLMKKRYPSLRLVGVIYRDTPANARTMLSQHGGDPFDVLLLDRTEAASRAMGVGGIPAMYYIDRGGSLRYQSSGMSPETMELIMPSLMKQL